MPGSILVVDDEPLKRITLQIELAENGYQVYEAADAAAARRILDTCPIDVVVSDVRMPGLSGLDLLTHIKQTRPAVEVILMTAYATIDTAVLAIKRGAHDYITKPFTTQELLAKLEPLMARRPAGGAGGPPDTCGRLVGRSPALRRVFQQVRTLAPTNRPVLIVGERGTGRDAVAETLHELSPRGAKPLVRFGCADVAAAVLENELFGYEKGAVPGAARPRAGRCELADGGTLLLDDFERIPLEVQPRLLRLLSHGAIERRGAATPIELDVRVICTTAADPARAVADGRLRAELLDRLSGGRIDLLPLRERRDDVPILAQHFLSRHARRVDAGHVNLSGAALDELLRYHWPGNVRELEHVLERALAFCDGPEIRPEHVLPLGGGRGETAPPPLEPLTAATLDLHETVADLERRMIVLALRQCGNNQARAAQRLGIPRTTLRDKMAKYNIPGG